MLKPRLSSPGIELCSLECWRLWVPCRLFRDWFSSYENLHLVWSSTFRFGTWTSDSFVSLYTDNFFHKCHVYSLTKVSETLGKKNKRLRVLRKNGFWVLGFVLEGHPPKEIHCKRRHYCLLQKRGLVSRKGAREHWSWRWLLASCQVFHSFQHQKEVLTARLGNGYKRLNTALIMLL